MKSTSQGRDQGARGPQEELTGELLEVRALVARPLQADAELLAASYKEIAHPVDRASRDRLREQVHGRARSHELGVRGQHFGSRQRLIQIGLPERACQGLDDVVESQVDRGQEQVVLAPEQSLDVGL